MPVTAKLSRKFYETFGDELTNEIVEWFNSVDLAYRTDLKEFNELNFARFDAKLEQRLGELDHKLELRLAELDQKFELRLAELDQKFERRLAEFDQKFELHLAELDHKLEQRTISLRAEMQQGFARQRAELIKWMFLFWIGTVGTIFLSRAI
jgi:tetrahydromethanopterin S-methyltransferase subunit G